MTDTPLTADAPPEKLAHAFDTGDRADWRALVDKALKGAEFDKRMVSKTRDGITINPIYARDENKPTDLTPGATPYTRGTQSAVQDLGWQIHQIICTSDPQAANREILEELDGGSNGIVLQVAAPGQPGLAISSRQDIVLALSGTYLDLAPIQFHAGLRDLQTAQHFVSAFDSLGIDGQKIIAHLNLNPIGNWARWGGLDQPIDDALAKAVHFAAEITEVAPKLRTISVDSTIAHEAGASETQELAFLAATCVAYLRAFETSGTDVDLAFRQLSFTVATDDDIFTSLAKLRAARQILCRIGEAAGVSAETIADLHITARTSERMLAKRDPWTNILRLTVACAAAAFSGVQAITVHPFTWALGQPDAFARRIARNTQIVCQEESSLGRVVDPAGGSWYVESLTDDLAQNGWSAFQDIERAGGIVATLKADTFQTEVAGVCERRNKDIDTRRQQLTGVSEFPILGDDGVTVSPWPEQQQPGFDRVITALTPHRLAESFEALRDRAENMAADSDRHPQIFLANLGRIVDHNMRSTWIKNLLAAGGIEALTNNGFDSAQEAAAAFKSSGTKIACICSSDAIYADKAADTARALKAAGATHVLLAGKPGDLERSLQEAGVDAFVHAGLNAVATLDTLLKKLT